MEQTDIRIKIQEELLLAKQSRQEGNEGRARVCARRAAGAAVMAMFQRKGIPTKSENAYQSLISFQNTEKLPKRIQLAVERLIQRVDQEHQLPPQVDLINEANILIEYLKSGD